ncbi:hypothetical protein BBV17_14020 [Cytobacillus oceanisediminis]|uniref:Uncharacterized protein n=1 Tax=Cytobacillus oceanisediminis TaxID=665099 RepID=A0ABX3CV09_9BACI|nr:hypothetical protein BBV17_14020 [Cytobacillus oceanisediminis]
MSCGSSGTGETPQTRSVEAAQRPPRGKRAAWSGNQRTTLIGEKQQFIRKEPIFKTKGEMKC